jgi:hypothetical protein
LVAGGGAVLAGGAVGVGDGLVLGGVGDGLMLGALAGAFCDVVVVVGGVALSANSIQAPIARTATTSRRGSTLQLPSSVRVARSKPVRGGRSRGV